MEDTRVTFIISMIIALSFGAYLFVGIQNGYIHDQNKKAEKAKAIALDPIKQWEAIREQRSIDLQEARKNGISHSKLIMKKCDCPHLTLSPPNPKTDPSLQALEKWRYLECKKACLNAGIPVKMEQ